MQDELTLSQFRACVAAGACKTETFDEDGWECNYGESDRRAHPMNCVSWFGADAFCRWVGGRLPAAAEWFAEASNNETRKFPWGDEPATCARAVADWGCGWGSTWPVCYKEAGNSVSGLCDLVGNVQEWMSDASPDEEKMHLVRGSAWSFDERSAHMFFSSPRSTEGPDAHTGFRCAQSL